MSRSNSTNFSTTACFFFRCAFFSATEHRDVIVCVFRLSLSYFMVSERSRDSEILLTRFSMKNLLLKARGCARRLVDYTRIVLASRLSVTRTPESPLRWLALSLSHSYGNSQRGFASLFIHFFPSVGVPSQRPSAPPQNPGNCDGKKRARTRSGNEWRRLGATETKREKRKRKEFPVRSLLGCVLPVMWTFLEKRAMWNTRGALDGSGHFLFPFFFSTDAICRRVQGPRILQMRGGGFFRRRWKCVLRGFWRIRF